MKLTERDVRLIKDVALSHVLNRDQIISLGYFSSVSRCNRRLHSLVATRFLKVLDTPFHSQQMYVAGTRIAEVAGDNVLRLLAGRNTSPRFLQHSLAVTQLRICLAEQAGTWRFEPQARHGFRFNNRLYDVRPDGVIVLPDEVVFVEADLGNTSRPRFAERFGVYDAYVRSSVFAETYGSVLPKLLVVTTGSLRRSHLAADAGKKALPIEVTTFESLGLSVSGSWS